MEILFKILCGILYCVGLCFNLTYQEISVYICIYGCPLFFIGVAIFINIYILYKTLKNYNKVNLLLLILSYLQIIIYIILFIGIYNYYKNLSILEQFNLCMRDLQKIAKLNNITYEECNLIIYVGGAFIILIINSCMFYITKYINKYVK